jgi:hypothetical protein
MKLVAVALALAACKGRNDCKTYLEELKAWGAGVDDRLAVQHVAVGPDAPSAPSRLLDPVPARTIAVAVDKVGIAFAGSPIEDPATWERMFDAARLGDPVAIAAAPDAPWWRVVVALALVEDVGFSGVSFVYLADPIPRPPRADLAKFAMPTDDKRITRYADWSNRIIDRCPAFGSLMWPQRGHDATPREMAVAAKDCSCEVDPVEISSWFAYDLLPSTMGVARAQITAIDSARRKGRPTDIAGYVGALRDELTVDAATPGQLAGKADAPWRDMAGRVVAATGAIKLRIAR